MNECFYLVSNASTSIYNNTLSKFTNHFGGNPLLLNAQDKYQVGLDEIYIHSKFSNIPVLPKNVPHIRIYKRSLLENTDKNNVNIDVSLENYQIILPYQHYTPITLTETINSIITNNTDNFPKVIKTFSSRNLLKVASLKINGEVKNDYMVFFHHKLAVRLGIMKDIPLVKNDLPASLAPFLIRVAKHFYYPFIERYASNNTEMTLQENIPKLIKVEINHVQPLIENGSYKHILSHHALNKVNSNVHHQQFYFPLYLTLSMDRINEFSVRLLDENDKQLKLEPNLPTILKMSLRKFDEEANEFNIVIDSTKKDPHHPNNTGSDFSFTLSPPIQLDDDYVCSINSVSYSTYFKTLPVPIKDRYILISRQLSDKTVDIMKIRFNSKNRPFFSIQDVINVLNDDLIIPSEHPQSHILRHPILEKNCAKFILETNETGRSTISILGFQNTTFDLPAELIPILGSMTIDTLPNSHNRWVFNLDIPVEKNNEIVAYKRTFLHPPDVLTLIPQTIWIYGDFVQPVLCGDSQTTLLGILPVKLDAINRHKNQYITELIERPNWCQVRTRSLHKLSFKLLRSDGREIGFEKDDDGVIISLTFRRKQPKSNNVMFL